MAKKKSPKQIISKNNDIPNTLPNNVKQEDFLIVLDNISKRLANKFRFAYHNFDDMKQQAAIFALEGLEKYDNSRPLENFLWTHVRNRLFNYKRNNYQRPDKPCLTCPLYDKAYRSSNSQCLKYSDKSECDLFSSWSTRNETKKNIIQPATIENDIFFCENTNTIDNINKKEIINFLDINIQSEYRESYLRLKHGTKIPKQQLEKLKLHIAKIMEDSQWKNINHQENEDS